MERGMHTHAGVPKVPVDHGLHGLADLEVCCAAGCRQMRNLGLLPIGIAGTLDADRVAVCGPQLAAVAALAAGRGVEHGAIEDDGPRIGQARHDGGALLEIRVLAKQTIGRHRPAISRWLAIRLSCTARCGSTCARASPAPEAVSLAGRKD